MDDVIAFMLEAEREAKARVVGAEVEADKIRRAAHQDAQKALEQARNDVKDRVAELRDQRRQEAQARKDDALRAFERELEAVRAAAQEHREEAIALTLAVLNGTQTLAAASRED